MDGREIQALRAMLAAQASETAAEKPKPRLLSRLLGGPTDGGVAFGVQEAALRPVSAEDDGAFLLSTPTDAPLPPQILLGDIAARRFAFGQRRERALELMEPAPREPARLTLTAPDGQTIGEIILHEPGAPRRRPFEAPHLETPFFPEDLEDRSDRRPLRRITATAPTDPKPWRGPKPSREIAATVLLAGLAARLAHEEAALSARLSAVVTPNARAA